MMTPRRDAFARSSRLCSVAICFALAACGGASQEVAKTPQAPQRIDASNQIIGARVEGTAKELQARGERALLAQSWQEAVDAFEALIAGDDELGGGT